MTTLVSSSALLAICEEAQRELILAAPFMKGPVVRRLISNTPKKVEIKLITRWRIDEICAGVSDLDVWLLAKERPGTQLFLCDRLHAKYYRSEDRCLVGSANLTQTALGWLSPSNLELLVEVSERFVEFERNLFATSTTPNESQYAELLHLTTALAPPPQPDLEASALPRREEGSLHWLPSLRQPQSLFKAYKTGTSNLTMSSAEAAAADLRYLDLPSNLPEHIFRPSVGGILVQNAVVAAIDELCTRPQRFGAIVHLIKTMADIPDATHAWQTLMRWLLFFLPDRYEVYTPHHSEIFTKKR